MYGDVTDRERSFFQKSFEKYFGELSSSITLIHIPEPPKVGKYYRIHAVYSYLRSKECLAQRDDDVILFLNAANTLVMKSDREDGSGLSQMESDFRSSGKDILFGASPHFEWIYPDAKRFYDTQYQNRGRFKYLNSNFYMGYKFALLQYLQYIVSKLHYFPKPDKMESDQRVLGYLYYQIHSKDYTAIQQTLGHLRLDLDSTGKYFMAKGEDGSIFELLAYHPYFLHFPVSEQEIQKMTTPCCLGRQSFLLIAKLKDLI